MAIFYKSAWKRLFSVRRNANSDQLTAWLEATESLLSFRIWLYVLKLRGHSPASSQAVSLNRSDIYLFWRHASSQAVSLNLYFEGVRPSTQKMVINLDFKA